MSSFEELLKERYPDGRYDQEVILNIDITNPDNDSEIEKEDKSVRNMLFANGNAQIRDFFEMVGFICESAMDDLSIQYMPFEKSLTYTRDPDKRLDKNIICYRVVKRRHTDGKGYKPRNTSDLLSEDDQKVAARFSEEFTTTVEFRFMSMNYDTAYDMMDCFEETLLAYSTHIKQEGIMDFWFEEQIGYIPDIDFREVMTVFVVNYVVKTQRNTVIMNEGINKINVLAKVVHEKNDNK